ncbi:MAG TPA: tripartite tricarboxylate transporter substrate binding protein [Burkholderiales bacterium]|nr:tripartite tricarboxylate transporter substrate binding protein [Burkholderiales bacterium]
MNLRPLASATLAISVALSTGAVAQTYPEKPVRLIVPASPGGGLDMLSRLVAGKLSGYWGQQLVIDNRPGAGMAIGTAAAAKSPADGYTLLFVNDSLVINPLVTPDTPFTWRDFAPIGQWVGTPLMVTVRAGLPATTFSDFLTHMRANPGRLNFAMADDNSRLASELFKGLAKVDYVHVPYKGAAPSMNALMGGEADFSITDPVASINAAKSGKVRLIAVTSAQRAKAFPQLPTVVESGVPGYIVGTWGGLLAPAGTPAPIVAKLNADARRALAEPDVVAKFEGIGLEIRPGSPEEFGQVIRADADKWAKLIKERNLKFGQ